MHSHLHKLLPLQTRCLLHCCLFLLWYSYLCNSSSRHWLVEWVQSTRSTCVLWCGTLSGTPPKRTLGYLLNMSCIRSLCLCSECQTRLYILEMVSAYCGCNVRGTEIGLIIFWEIYRLMGRSCSYLLLKLDDTTSQIVHEFAQQPYLKILTSTTGCLSGRNAIIGD